MAVNNNLARPNNNFNTAVTKYSVDGEEIKLSPQIVRQYLVNGQGNVTDQEVVYFINLCKAQKLNPFVKDAYLIKYGDRNPAQMVVSKDVFIKRAEKNEDYDGYAAGVIVLTKEGEIVYRSGSFYLKGREELVGGWAEVYRKNLSHPVRAEVSFDEYAGRKNDGSLNSQWASKAGTMIRKVAQSQAMREAFPNDLQQMYVAEEMNVQEPPQFDPKMIEAEAEQKKPEEPKKPEQPQKPLPPKPQKAVEGFSLV